MSSSLIEEVRTYSLSGYGKDKADAFGKAFAGLQSKVYASLKDKGLIIYMEPLAVDIHKEYEETTAEKILGFFKPKPTMHYQVEFDVTVKMRWLPLDSSAAGEPDKDQ
jgi:uncharacterized protein (TIGR03578 family)